MNTLAIISDTQAKVWQSKVELLNRTTADLLKDVGTALQEVKQDADSTIVDEIYKYGGQILEGSGKVLEGMNQILNTVSTLLNMVGSLLDKGKELVFGAIKSVTGYTGQ